MQDHRRTYDTRIDATAGPPYEVQRHNDGDPGDKILYSLMVHELDALDIQGPVKMSTFISEFVFYVIVALLTNK